MVPKRFGGNFRSTKSKILKTLVGLQAPGVGIWVLWKRLLGRCDHNSPLPGAHTCTGMHTHRQNNTETHMHANHTHVHTHTHAHTRGQTTSREHPERAMCLGLRVWRFMGPSACAGPTTGLWAWPLEFPGAEVTWTGFERKVSCMQIYSDERSATVLCGFVYTHLFKKKNGFHKRFFGNHLIFNTMFIYKKPHFKPLTVQEKVEASDCMTLANNKNLLRLRTSPPS